MIRAQLLKERKYFLETDVRDLSRSYSKGDGSALIRAGAKSALVLFQRAAKEVPAYRDFLTQHGVHPKKIKTVDDFVHVPVMQKADYLRQYPMKDLVFPGAPANLHTLSASSGSTGKPYLWPRGEVHELEGALIHETILSLFFDGHMDCRNIHAGKHQGARLQGIRYTGHYAGDRQADPV